MIESWELLTRLLLAAVAGMALGLERQRGGHPAGARTHLLVAVGACLFTLGGAYGFDDLPRAANWDPARVGAQVASGIGFIGAGAIIRDGATTRGLTTAATLWISGALGLCIGAGLIVTTMFAAVVVISALVVLSALNDRRSRRRETRLHLRVTAEGTQTSQPFWNELIALTGDFETLRRSTSQEFGITDDVIEVTFTHRDRGDNKDPLQTFGALMDLPTIRSIDVHRLD